MAMKHKVTEKDRSVPVGLGFGVLTNLAVVLIGAAFGAWLILSGKLALDALQLCALVTLFLAGAAGAWVTTAWIGRQRVLMCLLSGSCCYLLLLGITALVFEGQYDSLGSSALMVLLGCGVIVIMGLLPEKGKKSWGRKRVFR